MENQTSTSLDTLRAGSKAHVLALRGGQEFKHRISSMGLNIGTNVEVIQSNRDKEGSGAVVVRAGDTRLMIGHGMAHKVMVRIDS